MCISGGEGDNGWTEAGPNCPGKADIKIKLICLHREQLEARGSPRHSRVLGLVSATGQRRAVLAWHHPGFEFPGFLLDHITVKYCMFFPLKHISNFLYQEENNTVPTKFQESTCYLSQ